MKAKYSVWKIYFFLLLLILLLASFSLAQTQPYIRNFNTIRTVNVSNTSELNAALGGAQPGDLILLADGSTYSGLFTLSKAGTSANPILIKATNRAIVTGGFRINGSNNYVWGVEIKNGTGIELFCSNCGAINNIIYESAGVVGFGAWNNGSGQIVYGNIIWNQVPNNNNPHNIYTQNDFAVNGYKYFVSNVSLDSAAATPSTFNFHAYTEGNHISGLHVERNVFANGRFLIGGWNIPHYKEVVKENYFYKSDVQHGYRRPIQFQFLDNYLGKSGFSDGWHWGAGEIQFDELLTEPTVVTGNSFVFPPSIHWDLCTSAYTVNGREEGKPKLRPEDVSNNNRFVHPDGLFHGKLNTGGVFQADVDGLTNWRNWTLSNGGNQFDGNSTEGSSEPTKQFFIPNEYEPSRGILVVYNWENLSSISFARSGSFAIHKIKDPFGAPVVSGVNSVTVPLSGEFELFIVKSEPDPEPVCEIDAILQHATNIWNIRMDPTLTPEQKVRKMGREDLKLIEKAEACQE